jgi:hypothetical protein
MPVHALRATRSPAPAVDSTTLADAGTLTRCLSLPELLVGGVLGLLDGRVPTRKDRLSRRPTIGQSTRGRDARGCRRQRGLFGSISRSSRRWFPSLESWACHRQWIGEADRMRRAWIVPARRVLSVSVVLSASELLHAADGSNFARFELTSSNISSVIALAKSKTMANGEPRGRVDVPP